ncbi:MULTISPECIES: hypothetical protein [unclassified Duganella]|uniref:hypothetical protein n=1 Tax=unclassified Duganella TaxID=2636909 RepID=UPI0011C124F2|nr:MULTISPECIES: hypothetical protein [unclassified Duganella]
MSQTAPTPVDALPTPPSTSSPATFPTDGDNWVAAQPNFRSQLNALGSVTYNNAVDAYNNSVIASAQSAAAIAAVNAPAWAAGTYVAGNVRYSPADGRTYRCYVGVTGSTDPSADPTHWSCASAGQFPYLHVREEQSSGTAGGSSGATTTQVRTLNTVVGANTIPGASLSANKVTLPAGTYEFVAKAPTNQTGVTRLTLRNDTDSSDIMIGDNNNAGSSSSFVIWNRVEGKFTISATKDIKLNHYTQSAVSSVGLGSATSLGTEVYSSLQLWKVA